MLTLRAGSTATAFYWSLRNRAICCKAAFKYHFQRILGCCTQSELQGENYPPGRWWGFHKWPIFWVLGILRPGWAFLQATSCDFLWGWGVFGGKGHQPYIWWPHGCAPEVLTSLCLHGQCCEHETSSCSCGDFWGHHCQCPSCPLPSPAAPLDKSAPPQT